MSLYTVNLNDLAVVGSAFGSCYCGGGPVYQALPAMPGDTFDFGTVIFRAIFDTHGYAGWNMGNAGIDGYNLQTNFIVNFNYPNYPIIDTPQEHPLALLFTVPADHYSFQLAFNGTIDTYIPPAVPEPATWALLLLGFILVGIRQWRSTRLAF